MKRIDSTDSNSFLTNLGSLKIESNVNGFLFRGFRQSPSQTVFDQSSFLRLSLSLPQRPSPQPTEMSALNINGICCSSSDCAVGPCGRGLPPKRGDFSTSKAVTPKRPFAPLFPLSPSSIRAQGQRTALRCLIRKILLSALPRPGLSRTLFRH